eukprot:CAMPEP_0202445560 /NCGR_PEP_ID=MMETSP1360-20130828/4352_1 /ASSEMBLY_ACC=CAM_ASM_000848 /TAXON_ID=515479 /ORGANISM="Licmophora paradoxa, Strain CCMP2313" /LENGTH=273 /DNA_ID=CAMNT_0049061861 /DNA_START=84 /DNA_END=905 /DNA_ORIENTATION=-
MSSTVDLEDASTWPHNPVFFQAMDDFIEMEKYKNDEPLPIGIPVEFETPTFKGRILLRLMNGPTDEPNSHEVYFNERRRRTQVVMQGQFKERFNMADMFGGFSGESPPGNLPPKGVMRMVKPIMNYLAPGIILDTSDKPKVLQPLSCMNQVSIDLPGEEPDITKRDIPENPSLLGKEFEFTGPLVTRMKKRQKLLRQQNVAKKYYFETDKVYTFQVYNEHTCIGTYTLNYPVVGKVQVAKILKQPWNMGIIKKDGTPLFRFQVHHQLLLEQQK